MLRGVDTELGYNLDSPEGYKLYEEEFRRRGNRVHSLNSLLKDQTYNSKPDTHSFRRIAKLSSWFFNPWNSDDRNSPPVNNSTGSVSEIVKSAEVPLFKHDPDLGPLQKTVRKDQDILDAKKRQKRVKSQENKKLTLTTSSTHRENISNYSTLRNFKTLSNEVLTARRIIIIRNLPSSSSVSGLLNRICGGPLERIIFHENREAASVELYFIFPKDAQMFFAYGNTGLFIYNGARMTLEWANETNTENVSLLHPRLHKPLMTQVYAGARRSLLFVKEIPKHVHHGNKLHYPDPESNYSQDFNITQVLRDFSSLGNVVDVCPIISRKLSFCIHFDDIRAAMAIKKQCETKGTKLNEKYKSWCIHYGKDITDKPCLHV